MAQGNFRPRMCDSKSSRYSLIGNMSDSNLDATVFGIALILLSVFVVAFAILINGFLPEPLGSHDELAPWNKFNAGRAFKDLQELSEIGPKVAGTIENEVLAVSFLKSRLDEIINKTIPYSINKMEYDVQRASSCFGRTGLHWAFSSCYQSVQNVVVKLTPHVFESTEAILVNCHFDSMPTSPGASDDGLHCSVMLEMMRVLMATDQPLKKIVIFLFNGAEEDGLLASHGFITSHKWAKNIACFINLESCGAGGREILFQTGPNADILPQIYARSVPYPYGNVIAEELFQSGALPSDTDFRIFRDFGNLKGLDFAHYKNGYVYHTSSDDISHVSTAVIQHTGSNILALLRGLMDQESLNNTIHEHTEQAVFFDVLGQFMICYKKSTAYVVNLAVVLLSVVTSAYVNIRVFRGMRLTRISYHVAINFTCLGVGVFFTTAVLYCLALLIKLRELTMLWYANQWFSIIYYGVPTLFTITSVLQIRRTVLYSALNVEKEIHLFVNIVQMIITLFAFLGTIFGVRSIYVLVIGLVPLCVSLILINTVMKGKTLGIKLFTYVAVNLLYMFYLTYLTVPFFHLLIPMMGRMGATADTETYMWIMCEICVLLVFIYTAPVVLMVKKFWKVQLVVAVSYTIFAACVLSGAILKPFSDDAPERFEIMHVNRKLLVGGNNSTESSGFFLIPVEKRAPQTIEAVFNDLHFRQVTAEDCKEMVNCGVPLSKYSAAGQNYAHSYWTEAEKPVFPEKKELIFRSEQIEQNKTFIFNITGPAFSEFLIVPKNNHKLVEWSVETGTPKGYIEWRNETVYRIRYIRGLSENSTWGFRLTFDMSDQHPSYIFKLSWVAHFRTNNATDLSPTFKKVLEKFPSWTRASVGLSEIEEYIFN